MCPLCITTAALTTAGATSGGAGVLTLIAKNWRTLRRWAKGIANRSVEPRCSAAES